jgi:anti-sigma B factor antagonist
MEITVQTLPRCSIVKPHGRVDSNTAPELEKTFKEVTDGGQFRIVFDASEIQFMSTAGLRTLVDTQKTCRRYNRGQLVIAAVSPDVHRSLELAGFFTIFKVYDDVLEAVGSI